MCKPEIKTVSTEHYTVTIVEDVDGHLTTEIESGENSEVVHVDTVDEGPIFTERFTTEETGQNED